MSSYEQIIERVFFDHYNPGSNELHWNREELEVAAIELGLARPKNLGDIIYSFRSRKPLPKSIRDTQPAGLEWLIKGDGERGKYKFVLGALSKIKPNLHLASTLIPDATPEIIQRYALGDEQALLAIVRYNRLIDIFLGITAYSLQNHLRSTALGSQMEIDELYVGIDKRGSHYLIPVQAKGGSDQISVVQIEQDIAFCNEKFTGVRCRPVAAQFMSSDRKVALFELTLEGDEVKIIEERHYRLVPHEDLNAASVTNYTN